MTEIPAGWYNDPEDVTQLRYWNGTQWTEHRSPRALAGAAAPDGGAWGVVGTTFSLLGKGWAKLLLLTLPLILVGAGAAALAFVSLDGVLDPGLGEILDRVTEPGFDPVDDAADEQYIESIDLSVGPASVVGFAAAIALFALGTLAMSVTYAVFLAGLRAGREHTIGTAHRLVARRFPRVLGIWLLWSLCGLVLAVAVVAVFAIGIILTPWLLLVLVPALLVGIVYAWPFMALAPTALALAPTDVPPLRHTIATIRPQWGPVAGRLLILTLVGMVVSFAANIGTTPLTVAGIWAGVVVSVLLQVIQTMLSTAGAVVLYGYAGGRVDPEITADVS